MIIMFFFHFLQKMKHWTADDHTSMPHLKVSKATHFADSMQKFSKLKLKILASSRTTKIDKNESREQIDPKTCKPLSLT